MDLLDRLHDQLARALARPPYDSGVAFTIADVYQHLIPYRGIRNELGIWELAQYEDALLRLLAGERGYLSVSDPEVQAELQRELRSPNPILGIYRDYPAVTVHLAGATEPATAPPTATAAPPREVPDPEPAAPAAPRTSPPRAHGPDAPLAGPAHAPAALPDVPGAAVEVDVASGCRQCEAPLPDDPDLRFCPTCGADQLEVPCARCGSAMRAEWNFCIRCGTRRLDRGAGAA